MATRRRMTKRRQTENPGGGMGGLLLVGGGLLAAYFLLPKLLAGTGTPATTTPGTTDTTGGTTGTTTTTPNPVASPSTWTPAAAIAALDKATIGNVFKIGGKMTADQWKFFYLQLAGAPSIDSAFDAVFFPNGRPADQSLYTMMTATDFINALTTGGVHLGGYGLGWYNDDFGFGGSFKMGANWGNDYVQSMGPNTPMDMSARGGMSGIIPMTTMHPSSAVPTSPNQVAASPRIRVGAFHNKWRN